MTIKGLYKTLKEHGITPQLMHWESFRGLTLAIDTPAILHRYGKTAGYQWIKEFLLFICMLRRFGITPLFIYDGQKRTPAKDNEHRKRAEQRDKNAQGLDQQRQWLYNLQYNQPVDRLEILTCLRRKKKRVKNPQTDKWTFINDTVPDDCSNDDLIQRLQACIQKGESQNTHINESYVADSIRLLEACGLPYLRVEYEAEAVAARLMNSGIVHAVFTEDSDALAYGCQRVLCYKQEVKMGDERVLVYDLPVILEKLNMSFSKFQDFCILLTCDYNERALGFPPDGKVHKKAVSIGEKSAWTIFQVCDSLEDAIQHGYITDDDPLKIDQCRHIMQHDMVFQKPNTSCSTPQWDRIDEVLQTAFCQVDPSYLKRCLSQ